MRAVGEEGSDGERGTRLESAWFSKQGKTVSEKGRCEKVNSWWLSPPRAHTYSAFESKRRMQPTTRRAVPCAGGAKMIFCAQVVNHAHA